MVVDLGFASTLCCFGGTIILGGILTFVSFSNQNILSVFKKDNASGEPLIGESWYDIWEVSPTKTLYLRVPETGFVRQFTHFVLFWNNRVAFLNGNKIIYTIDNHKSIVPEDAFAMLRGEDVYTINIVTNSYIVKMEDRLRSLQAITSIQKGEIDAMNKSTRDKLISLGETMRESRKAINWSPNSSPMGSGLPLLKRSIPWGGSSSGDSDEMEG